MIISAEDRPAIEVRFWTKVEQTMNCWLWTGASQAGGYGRFKIARQLHCAHRIAYELTYGDIPDNLWVLHRCDNPACVNPQHLFLGTRSDNMLDAAKKGRLAHQMNPLRGEQGRAAKLTTEQVKTIRAEFKPARGAYGRVAETYGVSSTAIRSIIIGKTWRHLNADCPGIIPGTAHAQERQLTST